jgi:hypothetical protein
MKIHSKHIQKQVAMSNTLDTLHSSNDKKWLEKNTQRTVLNRT